MSRAGRLNNQRAFTLVELGIVLFLLSLFAVLSVPLFSSVAENHLNQSARRISGMVKYLYNEAALTATPYRLVFDLDRERCSPQELSGLNEWQPMQGRVRDYQLPRGVDLNELWIDGRGKLTTGTATIEIHPQGWLPATTLHLKRDEEQLSVHLLPFTGTAEIEEGYHEFD